MKRALVLCLMLGSCAPGGEPLTGPAPSPFFAKSIGACPWLGADGSATQISATTAVTAAHAAWLFGADKIAGRDLARFLHAGPAPMLRDPVLGEHVRTYGSSCGGELRMAEGKVVWLNAVYEYDGATVHGFAFTGRIAQGFSGGPVIGDDGAVLGITPGWYNSGPILDKAPGERVGFAYRATDTRR